MQNAYTEDVEGRFIISVDTMLLHSSGEWMQSNPLRMPANPSIKSTVEFVNSRYEVSLSETAYVSLLAFIEVKEIKAQYWTMGKQKLIRESRLTLTTYLETKYHSDRHENEWCTEIKIKFFTDIGTSLTEQIKEKLNYTD